MSPRAWWRSCAVRISSRSGGASGRRERRLARPDRSAVAGASAARGLGRYARRVSTRVSVVVPARNEAAEIQACIRSILEQQVEAELEVIVVDGSSTDGTAELARAAGAAVVPNPERTTPRA